MLQLLVVDADSLEGNFVMYEYSDVHNRVQGIDQICLGQSTSNSAKTSLLCCLGDVLRKGQDLVNDVDHSASEVGVLFHVNMCSSTM